MNNLNNSKPTRLSKVYFTWVIRDFGSAEWFHSLLEAIEDQDTQNRIEINIYLTAKIKEDDMNNIIVRLSHPLFLPNGLISEPDRMLFNAHDVVQVQDVGGEKDAITSLRSPTHFGRPNWDKVFSSLVDKHPETDVGVVRVHTLTSAASQSNSIRAPLQFFCGPPVLSGQLHQLCNKYSDPGTGGTRFFFGKGTFSRFVSRPCSNVIIVMSLFPQRTFKAKSRTFRPLLVFLSGRFTR